MNNAGDIFNMWIILIIFQQLHIYSSLTPPDFPNCCHFCDHPEDASKYILKYRNQKLRLDRGSKGDTRYSFQSIEFCPGRYLEGALGKSLQKGGIALNCSKLLFSLAYGRRGERRFFVLVPTLIFG